MFCNTVDQAKVYAEQFTTCQGGQLHNIAEATCVGVGQEMDLDSGNSKQLVFMRVRFNVLVDKL